MTKKKEGTDMIKIIILIALLFIVYMLMVNKTDENYTKEPSSTETIVKSSDLDSAQDQLDTVDVDGVDNGVDQLNSEVKTL